MILPPTAQIGSDRDIEQYTRLSLAAALFHLDNPKLEHPAYASGRCVGMSEVFVEKYLPDAKTYELYGTKRVWPTSCLDYMTPDPNLLHTVVVYGQYLYDPTHRQLDAVCRVPAIFDKQAFLSEWQHHTVGSFDINKLPPVSPDIPPILSGVSVYGTVVQTGISADIREFSGFQHFDPTTTFSLRQYVVLRHVSTNNWHLVEIPGYAPRDLVEKYGVAYGLRCGGGSVDVLCVGYSRQPCRGPDDRIHPPAIKYVQTPEFFKTRGLDRQSVLARIVEVCGETFQPTIINNQGEKS